MATKAPKRSAGGKNSEEPDQLGVDGLDTTPSPYTHDPRSPYPADTAQSGDPSDPTAPTGQPEGPTTTNAGPGRSPYDPEPGASPSALRAAENASLYNPNPNGRQDSQAADSGELKDAETSAAGAAAAQEDSLYNEDEQKKRFSSQAAFAKRNSKGLTIGGGVLGGGIVAFMVAILSFVPLKVQHIVQNFEQRY